mgnify:CR=1 FL=1
MSGYVSPREAWAKALWVSFLTVGSVGGIVYLVRLFL